MLVLWPAGSRNCSRLAAVPCQMCRRGLSSGVPRMGPGDSNLSSRPQAGRATEASRRHPKSTLWVRPYGGLGFLDALTFAPLVGLGAALHGRTTFVQLDGSYLTPARVDNGSRSGRVELLSGSLRAGPEIRWGTWSLPFYAVLEAGAVRGRGETRSHS